MAKWRLFYISLNPPPDLQIFFIHIYNTSLAILFSLVIAFLSLLIHIPMSQYIPKQHCHDWRRALPFYCNTYEPALRSLFRDYSIFEYHLQGMFSTSRSTEQPRHKLLLFSGHEKTERYPARPNPLVIQTITQFTSHMTRFTTQPLSFKTLYNPHHPRHDLPLSSHYSKYHTIHITKNTVHRSAKRKRSRSAAAADARGHIYA